MLNRDDLILAGRYNTRNGLYIRWKDFWDSRVIDDWDSGINKKLVIIVNKYEVNSNISCETDRDYISAQVQNMFIKYNVVVQLIWLDESNFEVMYVAKIDTYDNIKKTQEEYKKHILESYLYDMDDDL